MKALRQNEHRSREQLSGADAHPLATPACSACGSPVIPGGDICERCGLWQMEGQCVFCNAPIDDGQRYCGGCGNPPLGILCDCGTHSIHDFCPGCDRPLTRSAAETLDAVERYLVPSEPAPSGEPAPVPATDPVRSKRDAVMEQVRAMKAASVPPPQPFVPTPPPARPEPRPRASRSLARLRELLDGARAVEGLTRDAEGAAGAQQEDERTAAEEKRAAFGSNQAARRHFHALKVLLPKFVKAPPVPVGWMCAAYGVVHHEGPEGCSRAWTGGRWIYEESGEPEWRFEEAEL